MIDPLTKILIAQKLINQTTSDEFINATNIPIQRRSTCIYFITKENETKEINEENIIRMLEDRAISDNCTSY